MASNNKNHDDIEINFDDISNFFKSNINFYIKLVIISVLLFTPGFIYYSDTSSSVKASFILTINKIAKQDRIEKSGKDSVGGTKVDVRLSRALEVLTSTEYRSSRVSRPVYGNTQIDAITLQSLQDFMPSYISRLIVNNNQTKSTEEPVINSNLTEHNSETFLKENFNEISVLTNPLWITENIVGLNGMRVGNIGRHNGVKAKVSDIFGAEYIYQPYDVIKISAEGADEKTVRAILQNAQTALGRLLQYKSVTKWLSEEQQTLKTEIPSLSYQISEIDANVTNLKSELQVLNELYSRVVEDSRNFISPQDLKDLFAGIPAGAIPIDLGVFASRALSYEVKIRDLEDTIISSRVASKALKESIAAAKHKSEMFKKYNNIMNNGKDLLLLEAPQFNKLMTQVNKDLAVKGINFSTIATLKLHLLKLKTFSLIPQVFAESSEIIYDREDVKIGKIAIIGALLGLIFALIAGTLFLLFTKKSK